MNLFGWLKPRTYKNTAVSIYTVESIKKAWISVADALKTKNPSSLKQALITADKCLDNALRDVTEGETISDRLKNTKDKFDWETYDRIWKAHKVRNSMVHETNYEPPYTVTIEAINDLRKGLFELGVNV